MSLTKQQRRAREQSFPKCWCGNTIGLHAQQMGATMCSAHQERINEEEDFDSKLSTLRTKATDIGNYDPELEIVIDLIADMMEILHQK